jgi:RNase P/RNase MRP subunit POP5
LLKKVKRRYLALEIEAEETFSSEEFVDALWGAISRLYGEHGASRVGLVLIDYDMEKRFVVIRTVHTAVDVVRTALASITRIGNKPVAIHVLRVSGTIRSLYKKVNN